MANKLQTILNAIRTNDYATATESMGQVMQQKVEQRLAIERVKISKSLVGEAKEHAYDWPRKECRKCGHVWSGVALKYCPNHKCGVKYPVAGVAPKDTVESVGEGKEFESHCADCGYSWKTTSEPDKCPDCKSARIHSKTLKEAAERYYVSSGMHKTVRGGGFDTRAWTVLDHQDPNMALGVFNEKQGGERAAQKLADDLNSKSLKEAPETVLAGNGISQSLLRDKAGKKRAYDESY
jgi:predicted Zn-ribbon and HTH transcriptional regulator